MTSPPTSSSEMAHLEDLQTGDRLRGLVVGEVAEIISVTVHNETVDLVYRASTGIDECLVTLADSAAMEIVDADRPWSFDADGALFRLASEACRIQMAYLFDPFVAIDASSIDPLPHPIEAVYNEMLPMSPLRFLLADDPTADSDLADG